MKRLLPAVLMFAFGCGGGDSGGGQAGSEAQPEQQGAPAAATPAGGATVTGTVNFTGTASNPTIDMAEEPACRDKYTGTVNDPVTAVSSGKLANVMVYVKEGLPGQQNYPAPSTSGATLDQDGCLYHPRVISVMVNQPFTIRNSDPVLHNIKAVPKTNRGFNISQPTQGMETQRSFNRAEMAIPVECNVHGWMKANVFVMDHPYYSVSGEDGNFSIQGLPAGTYTLEAWHEKHGTKTATVTVAEDGSQEVSFTFSG